MLRYQGRGPGVAQAFPRLDQVGVLSRRPDQSHKADDADALRGELEVAAGGSSLPSEPRSHRKRRQCGAAISSNLEQPWPYRH